MARATVEQLRATADVLASTAKRARLDGFYEFAGALFAGAAALEDVLAVVAPAPAPAPAPAVAPAVDPTDDATGATNEGKRDE